MLKTINEAITKVPHLLFVVCGSMAVALLGAAARGDWILLAVSLFKQFGGDDSESKEDHFDVQHQMNRSQPDTTQTLLSKYRLDNAHWIVVASLLVSYSTYFSMCGFLQYYFYVRQRDKPGKWKCQPDRWLTKDNERHEIMMGSLNMGIGGTLSGIIATYILNGGYTALYFRPLQNGLVYLPVSMVLVFLLQDGLGYYAHRLYHHPSMYRRFHKWHHRYHSPTPFSSTAMHPVEFLTYQTVILLPSFIMPTYAGVFILTALYVYYYGVWAHSGIHMDAVWPWQPATIFHDDHHRYFHTNFGFNTHIWDWIHDTLRRSDRTYGEDIFHGWIQPKKTK